MSYGKKILERVEAEEAKEPKKRGRNLFISDPVFDEFQRKVGEKRVSRVVEVMMKHFNETTAEPRKR